MISNLIQKTTKDGKRFYEYPLFLEFGEGITVRTLSKDFDIADTESLQECIGTSIAPLSFDDQLHGTEICSIKRKKNNETLTPNSYVHDIQHPLEGDIFMTNVTGLPLMIRTADCAGVVIYDPIEHAFANIHAGWKGIAKKAVAIGVGELSKRYGSLRENMRAIISPMLGPCCARFTDPEKELPHFMRPFFLEEGHVDLWAACENQLVGSGLLPDKIFNPRICTHCHPEYFFSYRRDKEKAGRFGTIALLG